jgi:hypothetical protein
LRLLASVFSGGPHGLQIARNTDTSEGFEVKCEKGVKMEIQLEEIIGYLAVRFIGAGTVEEILRQFESIVEHCERANKNKLLLDFTEAQAEISLTDRYFFGERAKILARKASKVATVARPEQLDPRRFGEMVARNRWVNVRTFTNAEEAAKWLLE